MNVYQPYLQSIEAQQDSMVQMLSIWSAINSGSHNILGLSRMVETLASAFNVLGGNSEIIPLKPRTRIDSLGNLIEEPCGAALRITKRLDAPITVLLGGHMDTVYPTDSSFQHTTRINDNTMRGPGVTDMKGGLIVMLKALEALEASPFAKNIGWEVLINPDEELGSPSSEFLWVAAAKRHTCGLLFEPAFGDGSLVNARKGSANFTVVAKGRAAHAGRDFHQGRNAIAAIAHFIVAAEQISDAHTGITLNIGHIEGGGPVNIVPDLAICRFNIRTMNPDDLEEIRQKLHNIIEQIHTQEGISLTLHEQTFRAPKLFDEKHQQLFSAFETCAYALGSKLQSKPSGGACDGNILAAEGLTTIDTLGVIGGNIHTSEEYILLNSLSQRTQLTAYFLMKLANHEIEVNFA
ncbi:MAG: hydrolase [Parachlamydiaceae bacterium]|nr:hydrolase [Parachlamydiaceae bacterium]